MRMNGDGDFLIARYFLPTMISSHINNKSCQILFGGMISSHMNHKASSFYKPRHGARFGNEARGVSEEVLALAHESLGRAGIGWDGFFWDFNGI